MKTEQTDDSDLVLPRKDGPSSDGRPNFATSVLTDDLVRRDFTVTLRNAGIDPSNAHRYVW
jgi:hypothetical protein